MNCHQGVMFFILILLLINPENGDFVSISIPIIAQKTDGLRVCQTYSYLLEAENQIRDIFQVLRFGN